MNKIILITAFLALLVSTEVTITALAVDFFGVCMLDTNSDGESEKDSNEKSEDNKKIEILLFNSFEEDDLFSRSLVRLEKPIFSNPYHEDATPPPEV